MQSRFYLSIAAATLLVACTHSTAYSVYSIPEAGFTIEYPNNWVIEDGRVSGLYALHPPLADGEELNAVNAFYIWLSSQPSLEEFAMSQRDNMTDYVSCDLPTKTSVGSNIYPGLFFRCADRSEHYFVQGEKYVFGIDYGVTGPDSAIFSHMKNSIKISDKK